MATAGPATDENLGQVQGGDTTALPEGTIDLSACSNRGGPPAHAVRALIDFLSEHPDQLVHPPYESADPAWYRAHKRYLTAFAGHLRRRCTPPADIEIADMVAAGGVTEHLYVLARLLRSEPVAVITPEYSGTLKRFGEFADFIGPEPGVMDTAERRLERIRRAATSGHYRYVIFSNPNNPVGHFVEPEALLEVCERSPQTTLIVDEEYSAYQGDWDVSLVGAACLNVVVLQSSGKPFGITGGSRAGVLWTRQEPLRAAVAAQIPTWPLSIPEIVLASAALESDVWLLAQMNHARSHAQILQAMLADRFGSLAIAPGAAIHYRLLVHDDPLALHAHLLDHGINTRAFTPGPGRVSSVRITAPNSSAEFDQLYAALRSWDGKP